MIPDNFENTLKIYKSYNLHINNITQGWEFDDLRFYTYNFKRETNPETKNTFGYDIQSSFEVEYQKLNSNRQYFIGCPFSIYKSTYKERLNSFIKDNEENLYEEIHFVKHELRDTIEFNLSRVINNDFQIKVAKSMRRRKEFLIERLEALGYVYRLKKDKYGKVISVSQKKDRTIEEDIKNEPIDFSQTGISEKIIYLKKLGIYDLLAAQDPFNMSKNKLATILSAITGEKASSIQSAINPIDNPSVSQKNNPLKNSEKTEIIEQKLIDLGFKIQN